MLPVVENPAVVKEDQTVPGPDGDPVITFRIYRPVNASDALPGIYFIHGGGMVLGDIAGEDATAAMLCAEIGALSSSPSSTGSPPSIPILRRWRTATPV